MSSGTLVVLGFAAFLVAGAALIGVYKFQERGLPAASATFERIDAPPTNVTIHDLGFRAVHGNSSFLEDHLNTAVEHGRSRDGNRLRVEQMRDVVRGLTGSEATDLLLRWEGSVVRVSFSGLV